MRTTVFEASKDRRLLRRPAMSLLRTMQPGEAFPNAHWSFSSLLGSRTPATIATFVLLLELLLLLFLSELQTVFFILQWPFSLKVLKHKGWKKTHSHFRLQQGRLSIRLKLIPIQKSNASKVCILTFLFSQMRQGFWMNRQAGIKMGSFSFKTKATN